jgi:hypothetical protein
MMPVSFAKSKGKPKNAALVKVVKGKAFKVLNGKKEPIKKKDWLKEGTTVQTAEKSFVRLIYTDKSSMNVGPKSEMKIEQFDNKEPGMINMIKGKIRSKVSKDYLKIDKKRSKLLIRTPSAVMGVRGTEFVTEVIPATAKGQVAGVLLVVMEGVVASAPLSVNEMRKVGGSGRKIDNVLNNKKKGAFISAGKALVQKPSTGKVAAKVNVVAVSASQMKEISDNSGTINEVAPKKIKKQAKKNISIVPPGLNKSDVESDGGKDMAAKVAAAAQVDTAVIQEKAAEVKQEAPPVETMVVGGQVVEVKKTAFVDLSKGAILEPGPDASYDKNGNVLADKAVQFSGDGSAAKIGGGMIKVSEEGTFVATVVDSAGKVQEIDLGDGLSESPEGNKKLKQVVDMATKITSKAPEVHSPKPIQGPAPASVSPEGEPNGPGPDGPGGPGGGPEGPAPGEPGGPEGMMPPPGAEHNGAVLMMDDNGGIGAMVVDPNTGGFVPPSPGAGGPGFIPPPGAEGPEGTPVVNDVIGDASFNNGATDPSQILQNAAQDAQFGGVVNDTFNNDTGTGNATTKVNIQITE